MELGKGWEVMYWGWRMEELSGASKGAHLGGMGWRRRVAEKCGVGMCWAAWLHLHRLLSCYFTLYRLTHPSYFGKTGLPRLPPSQARPPFGWVGVIAVMGGWVGPER